MTRQLNHKNRRQLAPSTRFGRNVSFSKRQTRRTFKPNLQSVTVSVDGRPVRVRLSARQLRTLGKANPPKKLLAQLRQVAQP